MFTARPAILFLTCVVMTTLLCGCGPKLEGTYRGAVRNKTHNIEADLFMTLSERGDVIVGSLTIGAPLYGGGTVSGQRDGKNIQFTTSDSAGGRIVWYGMIEGRRVAGHYVVEPGMMNALFAGSEKQEGIWLAER